MGGGWRVGNVREMGGKRVNAAAWQGAGSCGNQAVLWGEAFGSHGTDATDKAPPWAKR